ncbi:hypothetical protein GR253_19575 [Rhizobium leguminosarum]|nr:hypothetical protein [Rhizobium leguminosarum]
MTRDHSDLPLFAWRPPVCDVLPFPLARRVGKIRDVASKLVAKTTERSADYYFSQVSEALVAQLSKIGIPDHEQDEQIGAFWSAVNQEVARLSYRGTGSHDPRGAA